MRLIAGIGIALLLVASVGAVHFDKYGGVVPKDKKVAACETKAAKQVATAIKKLTACHVQRALGKSDETTEEACEKTATDTFDSKVHNCAAAPCLDKLMGSSISFITDGQSGRVYCSGTTPFGDDKGDGFTAKIPPDKKTAKCENKVAMKAAALTGKIIGCHAKAAKAAIKAKSATDTDTDDDCEAAAKTAFKNGTKTTDCSCVDLDAIATAIVNLNDLAVERIACASPSGAFVDGPFD